MPFNPYQEWLGVLTEQRPPDHYYLLGIDVFKKDEKKIQNASNRQLRKLKELRQTLDISKREEYTQICKEVKHATDFPLDSEHKSD